MGRFAQKGTVVYNRTGDRKGVMTGSEHACTLEGCRGVRVAVKWPDNGKITYPCSKGLVEREDKSLQIG